MARPFAVEINGVVHPIPPHATVKVIVKDETIERHYTFADQLEESIFDADGVELENAACGYEDINSLYTDSYVEDEDEDEDEEEDETDEE